VYALFVDWVADPIGWINRHHDARLPALERLLVEAEREYHLAAAIRALLASGGEAANWHFGQLERLLDTAID
jgi:hypothetical protein